MKQASAQNETFALPEITEALFVLLPPHDLLVAVQQTRIDLGSAVEDYATPYLCHAFRRASVEWEEDTTTNEWN
jgi:hypothetical protein